MIDSTIRRMMQEKGVTVHLLAHVMDVDEGQLRHALQHPTPIWFQHITDTLADMESCKSGAWSN